MNQGHALEMNAAYFRKEMKRAAKGRRVSDERARMEAHAESWLAITITDCRVNFLVAYVGYQPSDYPVSVQKNVSLPLPGSHRLVTPEEVATVLKDGLSIVLGDSYDVSTLMQQGLGVRMPSFDGVLVSLPPEWSRTERVRREYFFSDVTGRLGKKLRRTMLDKLRTELLLDHEISEYCSIDAFATDYTLDGVSIGVVDPEGHRCRRLAISATMVYGRQLIVETVQQVLSERFKRDELIRWRAALNGYSYESGGAELAAGGSVVLDVAERSTIVSVMKEGTCVQSRHYLMGSESYQRYLKAVDGEMDAACASRRFVKEYYADLFREMRQLVRKQGLAGVAVHVVGDLPAMVDELVRGASEEGFRARPWTFKVRGDQRGLVHRALCSIQDAVRYDCFSRFPCMPFLRYRMGQLVERVSSSAVACSRMMISLLFMLVSVVVRRDSSGL
jgi:hypothetical protein